MSDQQVGQQDAVHVFCPQCGEEMRVARAHLSVAVLCPHCGKSMVPQQYLVPGTAPAPGIVYSSRSKIVAGLLGIFLGGFGAHRFYLGFYGIAVIQIVLTLSTCGAAHIWGLVEGILCLTGHLRDIDNLPLRD